MINEMRQGFETAYIDGSVVSNAAYRPQFVSNNHKEGKKVLSSIEDATGCKLTELKELCQRIVANRNRPKREPIIDGYGGFLFFGKEGKPMVALHWKKYIQHARDKYNHQHALQLPPITPHGRVIIRTS